MVKAGKILLKTVDVVLLYLSVDVVFLSNFQLAPSIMKLLNSLKPYITHKNSFKFSKK